MKTSTTKELPVIIRLMVQTRMSGIRELVNEGKNYN